MKKLYLAALLLSGLASCNKGSDDPTPAPATPALTGNAWVFQSEVKVTTPRNGSAPSTDTRPIAAGSLNITYNVDGTFRSATSSGQETRTGTYTFSNGTITIPYVAGPNGSKTQVLTVKELTANKLVTTESTEDTSNRYLTTDTFTR